MDAILKRIPTKTSFTIVNGGKWVESKELVCCTVRAGSAESSLSRTTDHSYHYYDYRKKSEVHYHTSSARIVTGCQWDYETNNLKVRLTRIDGSHERSKHGKKNMKRNDSVTDKGPDRTIDHEKGQQSHRDFGVNTEFYQLGQIYDTTKNSTSASGSSWARIAGGGSPLTPDEELSLSADVQDLLHLERQKDGLEKMLERTPTIEEWADYCGISVFKLYARIGKGRSAKRKMIAANLPLVNSVAERFHGRGLSHWELCQEGVQGLLKSTEKFDSSYNTKFSTYSFLWIWERMSAGVKKFRHVLRISRTVYEMASVILRHKDEFEVLHGRQPSLQELAASTHVDKDKIRDVLRLIKPVKSMEAVFSTLERDYEKEVQDQSKGCSPWTHMMEIELKIEVAKALQNLTPREQYVLQMRYGLSGNPPQGRSEVALALDLSYESIRLTEKKALDKLRHLGREDGLHQYLSGSVWE